MRTVVAAMLVAGGALAACSLFVNLDEQQCSSSSDCTSRGGAFAGSVCVNQVCVAPAVEAGGGDVAAPEAGLDAGAPDVVEAEAGDGAVDIWGCLSQPPEVLNANQQIVVTVTAFDALQPITTAGPQGSDLVPLTYTAVPGSTIQGCRVTDPACSQPVATVTTDDAGVATITSNGDFVGFFKSNAPGYLPSATYPGQLLADASAESIPTAMLGVNELQLLAAALGVTLDTGPDAGVGNAFFEVYDCFDHHAPGVTYTILGDAGGGAIQWYTRNGAPSTTATETDSLGAGGAVNVPVGGLTVAATIAATQQVIGTINPIVSPGSTTFAFVRVRTH